MTILVPSNTSIATLSDADLLVEVSRLAASERHAMVQLIASLAELDARRLYLGQGCASMFAYCTQVLHLSEHAAYNRIEAARAARRFPVILDRLTDGSITLTTVCLLAAHLTPANHREVLEAARHQGKRAVEVLVAQLRPLPMVHSSVRKLPTRAASMPCRAMESLSGSHPHSASHAASASAVARSVDVAEVSIAAPVTTPPRAPRPPVVVPLAPDRYKVQVTVSRETTEKLRRAQDLMRHSNPDGDPAVIIDRALTVLLAQLEQTRLAATHRPRRGRELSLGSRHIPAAVRRAVWARDSGQCAFLGADRRRCQERGFLEFHHTAPYAAGGDATVQTIELRCRAHNLYEAELDFGPSVRNRRRGRAEASMSPPP